RCRCPSGGAGRDWVDAVAIDSEDRSGAAPEVTLSSSNNSRDCRLQGGRAAPGSAFGTGWLDCHKSPVY
ncbi:hypothetical protein, partial [Salmonella enterica]|uniref:hypothetical protein n=1 Tax=Salmonella enterica TaxID=28901 RepID=UPI0032987EE9